MEIQTNAQIVINADIESIFDASVDCQNLPKFFVGYKAIPAIVSAKTLDGLPLREGSMRIVDNSDGSSIEEIIVSMQRPHIQKYKLVKGFQPPFSWLVCAASGQWSYEEIDTRTKIKWEFKFDSPNLFTYLIFLLVVKQAFQKAQEICLENIKRHLENTGDIHREN